MPARKPAPSEVLHTALPRPGEGKRGETGHLAYLLRQAAGVVRLTLERALAAFDVTPAQFVVLTMVQAYPGASGADIARLALLTPQTVHGITGNLEGRGLLARTPHPDHGRVQQFSLTAKGRNLLARCRARANALDATLSEGLTPAEETVVRRWLVGLAVRAEPAAE